MSLPEVSNSPLRSWEKSPFEIELSLPRLGRQNGKRCVTPPVSELGLARVRSLGNCPSRKGTWPPALNGSWEAGDTEKQGLPHGPGHPALRSPVQLRSTALGQRRPLQGVELEGQEDVEPGLSSLSLGFLGARAWHRRGGPGRQTGAEPSSQAMRSSLQAQPSLVEAAPCREDSPAEVCSGFALGPGQGHAPLSPPGPGQGHGFPGQQPLTESSPDLQRSSPWVF